MSTPMTPAQLIAQLNKWNVPYQEYKDWRTHNRNHKGKWGPVNGFMWHHTGSDSTDQRELLYNGYSTLPGPLCHFGISQLGVVHLIGWGRANHAGLGDDDVLDSVIAETKLPVDNESNTDGNQRFYGAEFWHSGNHHMPDKQYETGILLSAAICDFHGWHGGSILGHGEWQPGKWDPGYAPGKLMGMDQVRHDINKRLVSGPVSTSDPEVKPAIKSETYKQVWKTDAMRKPVTHKPKDENPYWEPESILRYAAERADQANQKLDRILKHLGLE